MKRVFAIVFIFFSFNVSADAWDDVNEKQAKAIQKHLKKHPIILDYCDCCDGSEVFLMRVYNSEIVPCSWSPEKKSVIVKAVKIGQFEVNTYPSAFRVKEMKDTISYTITMNYTFIYSKFGKWAVPFFKVIPYRLNHVCAGATNFPNPSENKEIKDTYYINWYKKYIA